VLLLENKDRLIMLYMIHGIETLSDTNEITIYDVNVWPIKNNNYIDVSCTL